MPAYGPDGVRHRGGAILFQALALNCGNLRRERLHEEFTRRIKTQPVLPSADTAAMLFWALLASGEINMRKVDGWQTVATEPTDQPFDLAA